MTSGEAFHSDTVESDGICMEILEPDFIVLPIPENRRSGSILVQINVLITNKTPTPFPFVNHLLMLELVGADAQLINPTRLINRQLPTSEYDGISIPPKRTIVRALMAKLSKANNWFEFQASIYNSPTIPIKPDSSWSFELLQLGTYQLRFTYINPSEEFSFKDIATGQIITVESSQTELLTSPWVNLRLIEPAEANKNAVEVDGIRFETLVPQPILSVPLNQSQADIPVQIGMQITNNTPTPLRLTSFDSLIPELIGPDGLIPRQSAGGVLGWASPTESDFHLVMPGENITLFSNARLVWQADGLHKLIVPGGGRANWSFNNLKLGTYQIQLRYRSLTAESDVLFKDLWMGMVSTPFIEFHLVQC